MTELTDSEIVAGLRSTDATEQGKALDALFPGDDVLMTVVGKAIGRTASSTRVDVSRLFPALLAITQQFGGYLGLKLDWLRQQPAPNALVVPPMR